MSVNPELQLIQKIIKTRDLHSAIKAGITPDVLKNAQAKMMLQEIIAYSHDREHYGCVPPTSWMTKRFPTVFARRSNRERVTIGELCQQVRLDSMRVEIDEAVLEIQELADIDPGAALQKMRASVLEIGRMAPRSTDRVLADDAEEIIQRFEQRRSPDSILGIPFPWDELNDLTQGIHNEDFIVVFGRPKCVVEGQRVLSSTGELVSIETPPSEVAGRVRGQKIGWGRCTGSYAGVKEAVRVTTQSGHVVEVGIDHPMLCPDSAFTPANNLRVGDHIGVARRLPAPTNPQNMPANKARLLGLLVGDGNYTRNEVQFTKGDKGVVDSLHKCVRGTGTYIRNNRPKHYRIVSETKQNPVLDWLRELGCHGQKSKDKRVPPAIFRCSNHIVAEFLAGYTDTDGTVSKNHVSWSTTSYGLALDIKHLLLRFGVTGVIQKVNTNLGTEAWYVNIYSQEQHRILNEVLDLASSKKGRELELLATKDINNKRYDDGIPYSKHLLDTIMEAKGDRPWGVWKKFTKSKLFRRTGCISRFLLRTLARNFLSPQLLEWADSDIRWEPIKSIEHLGPKRCWDITMKDEEHPTFVVENFITHNSMKSWMTAKWACHAYLHGNCRVLIYSCEMSTALFADRVACTINHLNYELLKRGMLAPEDWLAFKRALRSLKDREIKDAVGGRHRSIKLCSAFDDPNGGGVSHLLAKAEEFDPDLIVVDSFYRMKDDRSGKRSVKWDVQYNLVQDLKGITQSLKVPLIGVTQRHRSKKEEEKDDEDLGDIAYADAVGQEADAIYRIKKDGMLSDNRTVQLRVSMAGARESRVGGFLLHVVPSIKWRLHSWLDEDGKAAGEIPDEPPRSDEQRRKAAGRKKGEENTGAVKIGKPKDAEPTFGLGGPR